jgi:hypothetical protein
MEEWKMNLGGDTLRAERTDEARPLVTYQGPPRSRHPLMQRFGREKYVASLGKPTSSSFEIRAFADFERASREAS